jgi:hypothetical protein
MRKNQPAPTMTTIMTHKAESILMMESDRGGIDTPLGGNQWSFVSYYIHTIQMLGRQQSVNEQ